MNFKQQLIEIDGGRFEDLINALDVREACRGCCYFAPDIQPNLGHSCRVLGKCIGISLNTRIIRQLWEGLGLKSRVERKPELVKE